MTCIVGIVENGIVYIGADSAASGTNSIVVRSDEKVFFNRDFLIGFTTSYRMGQILRYVFIPPEYVDTSDLYKYMVKEFVPQVYQCLTLNNFTVDKNSEGGLFLVGFRGNLFRIADDFQVVQTSDNFMSLGNGDRCAIGALYATRGQDPTIRIQIALEAAAKYTPGVLPPFIIKNI